ncbi:hypothetical protein CYG68_19380 [Morganella morganii]|uniref:Uncharacterized protein n=1 Tax=Morganella morganii TaxID=582 RepID=A0A8I0Q026_MORMO|nr:hypothetical protein [Morganella morganii]
MRTAMPTGKTKMPPEKYTGSILQHDGEVQLIIDKQYSWNVGNVISLIHNKNLEEHAKLAITQGRLCFSNRNNCFY